MTDIYTLNTGVDIAQLCKDEKLTAKETKEVKKAAADGFTEAELKALEDKNIDIQFIKDNSTKNAGKKEEKTDADVTDKANEVADKYTKGLVKIDGDIYHSNNPQLIALEEAMNDGLISELADEGYSKAQIIKIIEKAFDNIGIKLNDENTGSYDRPKGHDNKAVEIYNFTYGLAVINMENGDITYVGTLEDGSVGVEEYEMNTAKEMGK